MRLPNRAERRKYNKEHKTHATLSDFALAYAIDGIQKGEDISWLKPYLPTDLISHKDNWDLFPDGTKVRLNYDGIMSRPARYLSEELTNWVEANKDEEFTVWRDPEDKTRRGLVSVHYLDVSKDTDLSKTWLFDMYSDLLVWSADTNTYMDPQTVEDIENTIADVKQSLTLFDSLNVPVSDDDYNKVGNIRKALQSHEDGEQTISDLNEWTNMDSDILAIVEKMTTPDEVLDEEKTVIEEAVPTEEEPSTNAAEEVVDQKDNMTEGGEN